jgi:hypothetical protein
MILRNTYNIFTSKLYKFVCEKKNYKLLCEKLKHTFLLAEDIIYVRHLGQTYAYKSHAYVIGFNIIF